MQNDHLCGHDLGVAKQVIKNTLGRSDNTLYTKCYVLSNHNKVQAPSSSTGILSSCGFFKGVNHREMCTGMYCRDAHASAFFPHDLRESYVRSVNRYFTEQEQEIVCRQIKSFFFYEVRGGAQN